MIPVWRLARVAFALSVLASAASAQTQGAPPPGAADGAAATPPGQAPICTDRPSKLSAPCTAEVGTFQVESDIVNGAFMRLDGVTTDTWLVTDPTLKYGLTKTLDIEASLAPYAFVRTKAGIGPGDAVGGVGDLFLRAKYAAYATGDGTFAVSLFPYVKAPTARSQIGNGGWEGGMIVPVSYKLTDKLTLGLAPELDAYKDDVGDGRHLNHIEVVNLGYNLPHNVNVSGEVWGDWDYDPGGEIDQYSADVAVAWGVSKFLQLDGGLNFGLNRYTPGVQGYVGVSKKF